MKENACDSDKDDKKEKGKPAKEKNASDSDKDDKKEKSKLAKVLCPCLSMLFDFGTAHIMVSYC